MPLFAAIGPILGSIGGAAGAAAGALGGASGIASLAGLGSSIYGAVNSANGVNASTNAQLQAAQQAEQDLAPWMYGGQSALSEEMKLLGLGGGNGSFGQPNYAAYVTGNPDVFAAFNSGAGKGASIDDFGKWHWNTFGTNENRQLTPFGSGGADGSGAAAQQAAFDALKASPLYQSLYRNGEQSVLANGAATGGLRGGNTNRSLYNLGEDTLAKVIQQQIDNLHSVSSLGQNAAAKVGNTQILGGQIAGSGATSAANANNNIANTVASALSNKNLLSAFGLGGGINTNGIPANAFPGVLSSSTPIPYNTGIAGSVPAGSLVF